MIVAEVRYTLAKVLAAVVNALIIIAPTRPLSVYFVPLALAAACVLVPRWLGK